MNIDSERAQFNRSLLAEFPAMKPLTAEEYAEHVAHRRIAAEDRRKSVRNLVQAARIAEMRLRDAGDEETADLLRMAIEGMRG